MTLIAYCIVPAGRTPPANLTGVLGAAVEAFPAGNVCCWASSVETVPKPSAAVARTHNDVIAAAMDRTVTPVPIRFGQVFNDAGALTTAVADRSADWAAQLRRFAGHAEYGVRLAPHPVPEQQVGPQTPGGVESAARDVHAGKPSGRTFMEGLARKHGEQDRLRHAAEGAAARIADRLGPLVAEMRLDHVPGEVRASLAHLVAWKDADAYHAVMAELHEAIPEFRLHVAGPWPPWSFVE